MSGSHEARASYFLLTPSLALRLTATNHGLFQADVGGRERDKALSLPSSPHLHLYTHGIISSAARASLGDRRHRERVYFISRDP